MTDIVDPMFYRESTTDNASEKFHALSVAYSTMYHIILDYCKPSAERTLAIRALQESRMWSNASLVFEGVEYEK